MKTEVLDTLTLGWFLQQAVLGWLIAYMLRVTEHVAYHKFGVWEDRKEIGRWMILAGSQAICIGLPLAYVLLAILAFHLPSPTFVETCAIVLPALTTFVAIDLRELVRRYKGD